MLCMSAQVQSHEIGIDKMILLAFKSSYSPFAQKLDQIRLIELRLDWI